jgi:hypothetical protein
MRDVIAHITHIQYDWIMPDSRSCTYKNETELIKAIKEVKENIAMLQKMYFKNENMENSEYEITKSLAEFMENYEFFEFAEDEQHCNTKEPKKSYLKELKIFQETEQMIEVLKKCLTSPMPKGNEVLELYLQGTIKYVKNALYYLENLQDYKALPKETLIDLSKEEDKNKSHNAALAPRKAALKKLGVPIEELDKKLDFKGT